MTSFGEVLATARRASGKTQEELASAAGITQAALSRYENGLREPDEEILEVLARELGVTSRFIRHAGRVRGAMAVDAHMRRRSSAQPSTWRRLESRLNMYRMHISLVSEEVRLRSEQRIPTFDAFETAPQDAARFVRMQWGMPVGPVRDLMGWVEAAGCLIVEEDFGTTRVDGLSQWVEETPVVLINSTVPTDRKRWTLAHELGHLALHSTNICEDMEEQANLFAAEFLMPIEMIRPQLRNLKVPVLSDIKREWGVSMAAVIEHAHREGLLSSAQRTALWKTLSSRGWRTREPISEELVPETPRLLGAVTEALSSAGLSGSEIARIAGFHSAVHNNLLVPEGRRLRIMM